MLADHYSAHSCLFSASACERERKDLPFYSCFIPLHLLRIHAFCGRWHAFNLLWSWIILHHVCRWCFLDPFACQWGPMLISYLFQRHRLCPLHHVGRFNSNCHVLPLFSCAFGIKSTKIMALYQCLKLPYSTHCLLIASDLNFRSFGFFWVELCGMGMRHTKIPLALHGYTPSFSSKVIKTVSFLWYVLAVLNKRQLSSGSQAFLLGFLACCMVCTSASIPRLYQGWRQSLPSTSWQ